MWVSSRWCLVSAHCLPSTQSKADKKKKKKEVEDVRRIMNQNKPKQADLGGLKPINASGVSATVCTASGDSIPVLCGCSDVVGCLILSRFPVTCTNPLSAAQSLRKKPLPNLKFGSDKSSSKGPRVRCWHLDFLCYPSPLTILLGCLSGALGVLLWVVSSGLGTAFGT